MNTPRPAPRANLTREGCGCENRTPAKPSQDCRKLMEQIRAVDFALYEVVLYLDAYPHCHEALETYYKLRERSEALHREYESTSGPLTAFGNRSPDSWDWMKKPFPWEYDAE